MRIDVIVFRHIRSTFSVLLYFQEKRAPFAGRKGQQPAVRRQPSNEQDTGRIGLVSCFLHFPLITNHKKSTSIS